jgi:hypothetical protein
MSQINNATVLITAVLRLATMRRALPGKGAKRLIIWDMDAEKLNITTADLKSGLCGSQLSD